MPKERKIFFDCVNSINANFDNEIMFKNSILKVTEAEKIKFERNSKKNKADEKYYFSMVDKSIKPSLTTQDAYELSRFFSLHKNIASKIALISLYSRFENIGRVNLIMDKILSFEPIYHLIGSEVNSYDQSLLYNKSLQHLKLINKKLKDSKTFKALLFYLYFNSEGEFKRLIDKEFEIKKGLIYLQKQLESVNFGYRFIWVWGPPIFEKSSVFSLVSFLKRLEASTKKESANIALALFYRGQAHLTSALDSVFNKRVVSLANSRAFYDTLLIKRFCSDDYLYSRVSKNSNPKVMSICSPGKLRGLYLDRLNDDFKFINLLLLELGDYSRERTIEAMSYE